MIETPPEAPPAETSTTPARRRARRLVLIGLAVGLLLTSAALYVLFQLSAVSATDAPIEVEIEPGWGAQRVAVELERVGLVRDARALSLWIRLRGLDRDLGEGVYRLSPNMSAPEIARVLAAGGLPRTVRLLIPEGFRAGDVVERLEAAGLGDAATFSSIVRQPRDLRPPYLTGNAGLEGFLFPASYDIPVQSEPEAVINLLVERFNEEIDGDTVEALKSRGLGVLDWVTLASMVQAEAAGPEEMPIIAGVFLNRLDRGMRLQSDPTVAYGLDKRLPELDAVAGDLERDHPWNTYTRDGLPATPIANPGRDALRAVLEPERFSPDGDPYLFFLHGTDNGVPVFRPNVDLEGHNRDVDRFLR